MMIFLLEMIKIKQYEYSIMCTGHMGVMANVSTKATIIILAFFKPIDDFLDFL